MTPRDQTLFERLSAIHAAAFAPASRGWSAAEIEALAGAGRLFTAPDCDGFALFSVTIDEAELLTLAVAPDRRRRGVAEGLMRAAHSALASDSVARAFLEVAADNEPAIRLYEKLGFHETGRRRRYYDRPDGGRVDALTMSMAMRRP